MGCGKIEYVYSHQTGVMNVEDVEWMIASQKESWSAMAVCITRDPKYCAEKSCWNDGAWDKLTTVYFSYELAEVEALKNALADKQWSAISCSQGQANVAGDGYFVCVLSKRVNDKSSAFK